MMNNARVNHPIIPISIKSWYKNCPPEDTIYRIREILYRLGVFITEESGFENGFFHSHIYVSNDGLRQFNIMTNGKGRTSAYALASAYSEMMERLQNGYKFYGERYATKEFISSLPDDSEYVKRMNLSSCILDYEAFCDEQHFTLKEYLCSDNNLFERNQTKYILEHGDDNFLNRYKLCCVPYYDIFNKKRYYLPTDCFNSGTNGMCAGNTPAEALVQGFCEIFERYALKKIMLDEIVPPQIPISYFEGTNIYSKIKSLEDTRVIVLDCSLQMHLPVLGAIIINTADDTYCLEMAGAATAEIALERCLTEHFQNGNPRNDMHKIFDNIIYDKDIRYEQFYNQSKGFGMFDVKKVLFNNAQYTFHGFYSIEGDTSEEELSYIIKNILRPNHLQCLVRDNSILGYPSYHIYLPTMSNIYDNYNDDDLYVTMMSFYLQPYVLNLKKQNKEMILRICENVLNGYGKVRSTHIPIYAYFLYNQCIRDSKPDNHLLTATLLLHCNQNRKAISELNVFVKKLNKIGDKKAVRYYNCALEYIRNIKSAYHKEIVERLITLFGDQLLNEVASDINAENQLQYYELPSCFNCEQCEVKSGCFYFDAMRLVKSLQVNSILKNQDDIIRLFDSITEMEEAENP